MPKYLQVFFSSEEKKELSRLAVELDTNMTAIVRQAVKDFLAKHNKTEKDNYNMDVKPMRETWGEGIYLDCKKGSDL